MKQTRIMESMLCTRGPGTSTKDLIQEGWYWGMFDTFKSKRNKKPSKERGKQHLMYQYTFGNGLPWKTGKERYHRFIYELRHGIKRKKNETRNNG